MDTKIEKGLFIIGSCDSQSWPPQVWYWDGESATASLVFDPKDPERDTGNRPGHVTMREVRTRKIWWTVQMADSDLDRFKMVAALDLSALEKVFRND